MGRMDELKDKAVDAITENRDKIEDTMDRAADKAREKTGDEHSGKIDSVLGKGKEMLDKISGDRPQQQP